jgi:hypothetical protein
MVPTVTRFAQDVIEACVAPVTVAAVPLQLPVTLPVKAPVNPVEVTDVSPAKVVALAPRLIEVVPTVTEELVSAEFATLASVPPSVRLPELVTVPVRVNPLTVPAPETLVTVPAA